MMNEPIYLQRARFYGSVIMFYMVTLLLAWYLINPYGFFKQPNPTLVYQVNFNQLGVTESVVTQDKVVSGRPVRLLIPGVAIDLPVDEGYYDATNQSWTLSAKHAQFAMPSMYANNVRGTTLIYGHYNIYVFYNLKKVQPGDLATVYTDNGHVFVYSFDSAESLKPDDVTVFDYQSFPRLTVQTCTGSFYEFRQMFYFSLKQVDGQDV